MFRRDRRDQKFAFRAKIPAQRSRLSMDTRRTPRSVATGRPRVTDLVTRVGCALGLPPILSQHGVDPGQLLRETGLPAETFDAADNVVPYTRLCHFIELAAARTGVSDLGLRACLDTGLRSLVTVGYLAAHSSTVGRALNTLAEYLYVHDQGGVAFLADEGPVAAFGYEVLLPGISGADQMTFGSVAIATNILRELCGSGFKIRDVTFAYPAPADITLFRRFFRVPARFGAERSAITFDADWLVTPVAHADSFIRGVLEEKVLAEGGEVRNTIEDRMRRVIQTLVATGRWSADEVAATFGMSRRTLARRLKDNGSNFRAVLERALFDAAQHLLESSSLPMLEIAARLGYADPASFARAFKRWSGMTPRAWRQRRAQEA